MKIVVAGGGAANKSIRCSLRQLEVLENCEFLFPSIKYCTDNGAMIAYAGSFYLKDVEKDLTLNIKPRWPLSDLNDG